MADTISQQVIDFTANYTSQQPDSITESTTLESIGIVTIQDTIEYMMELEDSFELIYEESDASGIVTVGDAIELIKKKLGG